MKYFLKNTIIKKILFVLIAIIMVSNFIIPYYVCAASPGASLVSGVFYLIAYVGDIGIKILQEVMLGTPDIKDGMNYSIKYSPGVIFANEVPTLDVNFISPSQKTINKVTYKDTATTIGTASSVNELYQQFGKVLLAKVTGTSETNTDDALQKIDNLTISEGTEDKAGQITINVDSKTYTIKSWYIISKENRAVYTGMR